jgi:hypothetical protein
MSSLGQYEEMKGTNRHIYFEDRVDERGLAGIPLQ